jgi:predicted DNA-binding protein YlxM (UPF0122 family)
MNQSTKYDNTRAMYLQRNKMATTRGLFYKGCHFGEMCTISPVSLCVSTAVADVNSEVFFLSKSELWKILLFMSRTEQRTFLIKLFTEVNGVNHSPFSEERLKSVKLIGRTVTTSMDNLYDLSDSVMNEIVDEGIRRGNIHENVKHTEDVFFRILSREMSQQAEYSCPWFEVLRSYEQKKVDTILSATTRAEAVVETSQPYLEIKRKRGPLDRRSVSTVSDDIRLRIQSLFQFMDLDGSGEVSREELMSSLQALGWKTVTWGFVDQLIADTVRQGDRLHLEDIVEVICRAVTEQKEYEAELEAEEEESVVGEGEEIAEEEEERERRKSGSSIDSSHTNS